MKIAYPVYDYAKPGGIEKYVRALAERLAFRGHEIHVFTTETGNTSDSRISFHKIDIPEKLPGFIKTPLFACKVKKVLLGEKYDILHSQGADCLSHNVLAAHSCHKAWVIKAKSFGLWETIKKLFNPLHRVILRNERKNYEHHQYVIAVSEEVKREIVQYYSVPEKHVTVVYPGIDTEEIKPDNRAIYRADIRKKLGLQDKDYAVLFVSNEFRRKGLEACVRAVAKLKKSIKLMVVGKGDPLPYRRTAEKLGIAKDLIFVKQVRSVKEYYAAADLFLLPTKHEAFGMVVTEAMAASLPVIVSKIAGAAELITDERCLLQDPEDAGEIAGKIRYFYENQGKGREIGLSLRKVIENHTWDAMAEKILQVYRKVLEQNVRE